MDMAEYNVLLAERLAALKVTHRAYDEDPTAKLFNAYQRAADSLFAVISDLFRHDKTIIITRADGSDVWINQPGHIYSVKTSRAYWYSGGGYGGYEMTAAESVEVK